MSCNEFNKTGSTYTLRLYSGIDLTSATNLRFSYTDPNGGTDDIDATVWPDDSEYAIAEVTAEVGTIKGTWKFEIRCTIGGNPYISYETYENDLIWPFE